MKQLNVFDVSGKALEAKDVHFWRLSVDGASRNNPGLAGAGIVIAKDNNVVAEYGYFIGIKTNNQAEYLALLLGLIQIKKCINPDDLLLINSDSELMVKQIKGLYRVKNADLRPLYNVICSLLNTIQYDIGHVLRDKNVEADALANKGIDNKIRVPEEVLKVLHENDISL